MQLLCALALMCLSSRLPLAILALADQMGHGVETNQNVYTKMSLARRREAVNALETALGVM